MEQKVKQRSEMDDYNCENNPNAAILVYALQNLGYKNDVALCDIIDNSIDAGATKISLYIEKDRIMIADNGEGMTLDTLDEALKLGSNVTRGENNALGKFGMGLSTASMSIADKTTVLTKNASYEEVKKISVDINIVKLTNKFVKLKGDADSKETDFFKKIIGEETGTIVILEQCTGIKNRNEKQFENKMVSVIARIYRKFMNKIEFYVNEKRVEADDPLWLDDEETIIYSDEDYDVKWKDRRGNERKTIVHAKLVILPEVPKDAARQKKVNIPNQGFSILRNSREIVYGYLPWIAKHNSYNRFRGEILFQSDMDEAMGIEFKKDGIDMMDSVNDILKQCLQPQIVAIRNEVEKETSKKKNKTVNHENAQRLISSKSNILITPKINESNYDINTYNKSSKKKEIEVKENKNSNISVDFRTVSAGRTGNIFEAHLEGKVTVIEWNINHPFYERFVLSVQDNKNLVTAVDYLIYSIATSQLKVLGDDYKKAEIIDQLISVMSSNMRVLLG